MAVWTSLAVTDPATAALSEAIIASGSASGMVSVAAPANRLRFPKVVFIARIMLSNAPRPDPMALLMWFGIAELGSATSCAASWERVLSTPCSVVCIAVKVCPASVAVLENPVIRLSLWSTSASLAVSPRKWPVKSCASPLPISSVRMDSLVLI